MNGKLFDTPAKQTRASDPKLVGIPLADFADNLAQAEAERDRSIAHFNHYLMLAREARK